MAMDRATYTAEDVLDLLRDVETNIREGNGHFAAPVSTREAQHDTGLIPPMRDIRRPRIWLPQHASRVPIPPIANSREEWPPRYFDTFQATSTDDLTRPRVKLPQHASRISALFITDLREGLSFPTSSIDRTHVQSSRDLGAHTFPLLGDSLKGQVASANHEADNLDRPGMVHGETLSKIATCEQEESAEVASVGAGGDRPIKSQSEAAIASAVEGRRLFIGNLAYATTEQELEDFFKDYPVEATSIPLNPRTARPVGYAFVDISTSSEADRAIQERNGQSVLDRKVYVQLAAKPKTPNTAQKFQAEDIAPNLTRNQRRSKRRRDAKVRDDDDDEQQQQQHASKRVKLAPRASTLTPLTWRGIANRCFSAPPHQLALLDWDDFEMGTSGPIPTSCDAKIKPQKPGPHNLRLPSEEVSHPDKMDIDSSEAPTSSRNLNRAFKEDAGYWNETARRWKYRNLSSGDSSMLHSDDDTDVDPPETLTPRQKGNSVSDEGERYRNETARKWKARMTDQNLPSYASPQNAGDLKYHKSPLRSTPRKDIDAASDLPASSVGLFDLPDDLLDRIFTILLRSEDEVTFNVSWLMPVVDSAISAADVTSVHVPKQGATLKSASVLSTDLTTIKACLKAIPDDKWPLNRSNSQTIALTRSLLAVSKAAHERAARIFYGSNKFRFSHPKTCWMHLQSFLVTVGSKNASHIRHIRIFAPIWDPGLRRDAITGALFDAMAPVTRLAGFTVPADDRLLSAIKTCVDVLGKSGNLESLQLDVMYQHNAVYFIGLSQARNFPVLADEAACHEQRRVVGRQLFKRWSDTSFGPANKPRLVAHAVSNVTPLEASGFRRLLASMIREAERYGWVVDHRLKWPERNAYKEPHV